MTVASLGSYVAASYNNPYMSQSIGSDFGGSIFGITEDGVSRSLQYREMSDSQVARNAKYAASNHLSSLTIVRDNILSGNTSTAIETFDAIVEEIMNDNSYYNIDEGQARSIAKQAFYNAFGVSLEEAVNASVDSIKDRAAKEANGWIGNLHYKLITLQKKQLV